jgi:Na+-translocating ferredoxin:NAD+ oxidoreductase RnfD subunit
VTGWDGGASPDAPGWSKLAVVSHRPLPTPVTARTIALSGRTYPLVLPTLRDPRLHVAAVILTIHALGQIGLHFRVSIPQILAAILTTAIIEVVLTFRQSRSFVWPASAMLTGSGVALILRVVGTPANDPWDTYAWWVFAAVAAFSLLTKYVIKYRGSHVFNPSNLGLVVTFVVLGSARVEPLDFWWGPLDLWLLVAYVVIVGGGLLITRRLHLLVLAATFWVVFAAGLGLLAASGHCMTANWAFAPVCGGTFWRVVVTSPELMIFLFFMITDPKTVPSGRVGRVVFGALVAVTSLLLIAPQTDEFGTKVALLAGLVVMCAVRPLLDRVLPAPRSAADDFRSFALGPVLGGSSAVLRRIPRIAVAVLALVIVSTGVVVAGAPARGVVVPDASEMLARGQIPVDPATLPRITVGQDVIDFDHRLAGSGMNEVVVTLGQNLELEALALRRRDPSILTAVDHGDRLAEMRAKLGAAPEGSPVTVVHYAFDAIDVSLLRPFGMQTGLSLGMHSTGTATTETYDASGTLVSRTTAPFSLWFVVRRATGARWLDVAVSETRPAT